MNGSGVPGYRDKSNAPRTGQRRESVPTRWLRLQARPGAPLRHPASVVRPQAKSPPGAEGPEQHTKLPERRFQSLIARFAPSTANEAAKSLRPRMAKPERYSI